MLRSTVLSSQWRAESAEGESLLFQNCKGGYFSNNKEYTLKVVGKTHQASAPTIDSPVEIECVKGGSKIICGESEIILPCDLYDGDIWYPNLGRVERYSLIVNPYSGNYEVNYSPYYDSDRASMFYIYSSGHLGTYGSPKFIESSKTVSTHFHRYDNDTLPNTITNQIGFKERPTAAPPYIGLRLPTDTAGRTNEAFRGWIEQCHNNAEDLVFILKRVTPLIETYPVQKLSAELGNVEVIQEPTGLKADLSATMLVKG